MSELESRTAQADEEVRRAKPIPRRLPLFGDPPDLVPARIVNEVLYCERLAYLEWAQGEFADNVFTVEGRLVHRRADTPGGVLPPARESVVSGGTAVEEHGEAEARASSDEEADSSPELPPYQARSVWLSSEELGLTAKIDVVEGSAAGRVIPIEYKRSRAPDVPEGAYLPERAQLGAHVLLLRAHGYDCDEAAIYFAGSRKRVSIVVDEKLLETTRWAVRRAKELAEEQRMPPPLVESPKCNGCSLVGICLPDETTLLGHSDARYHDERKGDSSLDARAELEGPLEADPWGLTGDALTDTDTRVRRLHPARDDRLPLYVQEQGARITLDGDRLSVQGRKAVERTEARLPNTSQVCVLGNVQVTTQAMRALLEREIPLTFFTYGGWFLGRLTGHGSKNVELRIAQHAAAADTTLSLKLARSFVVSKILNSRTMLRRNAREPNPIVLGELEQLARKAREATCIGTLLGLEGTAARTYFGAFSKMLKGEASLREFALEGRNRRPPRDPINALLSFTYGLLTKDFAVALGTVGLDPMLGFYHRPRFGRPALALDLMEEFRPILADSVVIGALNNGSFDARDFVVNPAGAALKPHARKRLISAYERRMDQLVTHPVFGYRISYRRVLEVQARLLSRLLLGEIGEYPVFRTR